MFDILHRDQDQRQVGFEDEGARPLGHRVLPKAKVLNSKSKNPSGAVAFSQLEVVSVYTSAALEQALGVVLTPFDQIDEKIDQEEREKINASFTNFL